jgi:hypothetical protein
MLTFKTPETHTSDRARIRDFTVSYTGDLSAPNLEPPLIRVTIDCGSQAGKSFTINKSFSVTITSPQSEAILKKVSGVTDGIFKHIQGQGFLPSGKIA